MVAFSILVVLALLFFFSDGPIGELLRIIVPWTVILLVLIGIASCSG